LTRRNPWVWVSSLYLAEGLPYVVVMTLAVKVVGVFALNARVAGTEQVAPAGMPAQLSDAVPLIPPPPMESV